MKRAYTILTVAILLMPFAAEAGQGRSICETRLEAARALALKQKIGEAEGAFQAALTACRKERQKPEALARAAVLEGDFRRYYENDLARAIEVYESGLTAITAARGETTAERVGLLDALADALGARALQQQTEAAGLDQARSLQLFEEALEVRKAVYGAESAETVHGLLLLGYHYLGEQPSVAEGYAEKAVGIAAAVPSRMPEAAWGAYTLLSEVYKAQGRIEEAERTQELAMDYYHLAEPTSGG